MCKSLAISFRQYRRVVRYGILRHAYIQSKQTHIICCRKNSGRTHHPHIALAYYACVCVCVIITVFHPLMVHSTSFRTHTVHEQDDAVDDDDRATCNCHVRDVCVCVCCVRPYIARGLRFGVHTTAATVRAYHTKKNSSTRSHRPINRGRNYVRTRSFGSRCGVSFANPRRQRRRSTTSASSSGAVCVQVFKL